MIKTFLLVLFLIVFAFAGTNSCSQTKSTNSDTLLYIGSTPCDSLIQSMLGLQPDPKCEFIKWRFSLYKNVDSPGRFHLSVMYGEGQPNTNGFKNGGKRMEVTGTYTVHRGTLSLPKSNVYELHNSQVNSSIWLVQIDDNIFHFADSKNNLIVGNGGWGYVLNRFKK